MKCYNTSKAVLVLAGVLLGTTAHAASVTLTADGASNGTVADFWTVNYSTGLDALAVTSINIDLSSLGSVAFDFDGNGTFGCNQALDPSACLSGGVPDPSLDPGPVLFGGETVPSFSWVGTNPSLLSIDTSGMGNAGDWLFSFGADTDGSAGSGDLMAGAEFTVFFSDGSSESAFLANTCGQLCSTASVGTTVVPVPAAVWLFGSGLLGLVGVARRKR